MVFFFFSFFFSNLWDPDLDEQVSTVRITQEFIFFKNSNEIFE